MTRCGVSHVTRLANPRPKPTFPRHLSVPFQLQRKPKGEISRSVDSKIYLTGYCTFEVASRFVAADSSSPGAREAREMGERKSTRVKTVAKALKRVDDDTRRQVRRSPPSVRLPDPMPPSRSAR